MKRFTAATTLRLGLIAGALTLGALTASAAWSQGASQGHVVTMDSMSFGRIPTGLTVGDTITWVNRDTVQHSATARDKSFDVRLGPGQSQRMVLQKPGAIAFYCLYHPTMRGTLVVAAK